MSTHTTARTVSRFPSRINGFRIRGQMSVAKAFSGVSPVFVTSVQDQSATCIQYLYAPHACSPEVIRLPLENTAISDLAGELHERS